MRKIMQLLVMGTCLWVQSLCSAASFPERSIQLYVPFAAGGSIDISARALAKGMEKRLGTPVVIVNKPGAGGTIALAEVARARPDGYSIGVAVSSNLAITPHIQKVAYDPLHAFSPIGIYAISTTYIAVRADSPLKTLEDVLADIKARPGAMTFGITTTGSTTHLSTYRLLQERGLSTEFVTFGGGAQVITALLGGHIPIATLAGEALPYVTSGKLRFIASFSVAQVPALASVRPIQASGVKWEADSWVGLVAPAGLDAAIRQKLETAMLEAAAESDYRKVLEDMAMLARVEDGERLRIQIGKSYEDMGRLTKAVGLVP